jgi:Fe-S-cluster containining protein
VPADGLWGPPPEFEPPAAAEESALCGIYERADAALGGAATSCRACGQCCSFKKGGLVLFASGLEMALLAAKAGRPAPGRRVVPGRADDPWQCPYQASETTPGQGALCGAHPWRPLGCRTYFCRPEAREAGERIYAVAYREIVGISPRSGVRRAWWYGPARAYLARV